MALSESRRKANDKYIKAKYSRVALSMPNAEAEALEEYCKQHKISKAGFITFRNKKDPRGGLFLLLFVVCGGAAGGGVTLRNSREE